MTSQDRSLKHQTTNYSEKYTKNKCLNVQELTRVNSWNYLWSFYFILSRAMFCWFTRGGVNFHVLSNVYVV